MSWGRRRVGATSSDSTADEGLYISSGCRAPFRTGLTVTLVHLGSWAMIRVVRAASDQEPGRPHFILRQHPETVLDVERPASWSPVDRHLRTPGDGPLL